MPATKPALLSLLGLALILALSGCGEGEGEPRMEVPWYRVLDEASLPSAEEEAILASEGAAPEDLAEVTLPVLLPSDPEMLSRLELSAHSHLYAALMRMPTYIVSVTGIRVAHPQDAGPPSVSDYRAEAKFYRWGVLYHVKIDCESADASVREKCNHEETLDRVIDGLILANAPELEDL